MPLAHVETTAEFHVRMIRMCDALARRLEQETATAPTEQVRTNRLKKAAKERTFAQLHCERLAQLGSETPDPRP